MPLATVPSAEKISVLQGLLDPGALVLSAARSRPLLSQDLSSSSFAFPASVLFLCILQCWFHSPVSLLPIITQEPRAYIILTKRKPCGKGNLSSQKHGSSRILSDGMSFGYVPMSDPIAVATVRIHCLAQWSNVPAPEEEWSQEDPEKEGGSPREVAVLLPQEE